MLFSIDDREHATILAALRYWQRKGLESPAPEDDIATNAGTLIGLSAEEIDELCEWINCSIPIPDPGRVVGSARGVLKRAKSQYFQTFHMGRKSAAWTTMFGPVERALASYDRAWRKR
jgi:hypothetical protein